MNYNDKRAPDELTNAGTPEAKSGIRARTDGGSRQTFGNCPMYANPVEREYVIIQQAQQEIAEREAKLNAISNGTWTALHNIKVRKAA